MILFKMGSNKKEILMHPKIILYTLSTCSHCKVAKDFFSDNGFDYKSIDVDLLQGKERKSAINEVKQHNSKLSFPTIIIDGKTFVGFKKREIQKYIADRISGTPLDV